ncbi:hypothetical protein ABT278_35020, partial [Streptomyces sp. NPDC001228]|uniref:hypothetical protein n=1 Tax=Streptomyces sp. NPDC001228 TaxID=3154381 RepID=UPI00332983DE
MPRILRVTRTTGPRRHVRRARVRRGPPLRPVVRTATAFRLTVLLDPPHDKAREAGAAAAGRPGIRRNAPPERAGGRRRFFETVVVVLKVLVVLLVIGVGVFHIDSGNY